MTKMEYAQEIAKATNGEVKVITKTNGVEQTGIVVTNNNGVGTTVYIDDAYNNGYSIEEGIAMVNNTVKANATTTFNTESITNWSNIRENVRAKLLNKERNPQIEVYKSAKGYGFPDLIIVPYIDVKIGIHKGSITITNALLEQWGITKRTVIDKAIANTDYVLMTLAEKLGMLGFETPESPILFIGTDSDTYGAIGIIKAKERLTQLFPNGYYIIPSSVHEMLAINADMGDETTITAMVQDVNGSVLDPKDYLSNHAYTFNVA